MKPEDIAAIQKVDTKNHIYLEVVNKKGASHLKAVKKNWFGRFFMKLGCSNASMKKVVQYLGKNLAEPLEKDVKDILKDKIIEKWGKRHSVPASITNLFKTVPPEKKQETKQKELTPQEILSKSAFDNLSEQQIAIFKLDTFDHTKEWEALSESERKKLGFSANHDKARSRWKLDKYVSRECYHTIDKNFVDKETKEKFETWISELLPDDSPEVKEEFMMIFGNRLRLLDQELGFGERMGFEYYTVEEILGPLKLTGLRLKIMDREGLEKLTLKELQTFSEGEEIGFLRNLSQIAYGSDFTKFSFINELNALDKISLNEKISSSNFPYAMFVNKDKFQEIEPTRFTKTMLQKMVNHALPGGSFENRLTYLTSSQIEECLRKDILSQEEIHTFSATQIKKLPFKDQKSTDKNFHLYAGALRQLAIWNDLNCAREIVKSFNIDLVIDYLLEHASGGVILVCCSDEQIQDVYKKCSNLMKEFLNLSFSLMLNQNEFTKEASRFIKSIPLTHLNNTVYEDGSLYKHLTDLQKQHLKDKGLVEFKK